MRRATEQSASYNAYLEISIHALLAESDVNTYHRIFGGGISIHALLAESDFTSVVSSTGTTDFYPRSPCGERLSGFARLASCAHFYPRSPCGERRIMQRNGRHILLFLSTLSLRRATDGLFFYVPKRIISIHALLAESDRSSQHRRKNAYPFLSTLSLRRATSCS